MADAGAAVIDALEARAFEEPENPAGFLVLADALASRGDPRGELITVDHALSTQREDGGLKRRRDELIAELDRALAEEHPGVFATWELGFIRHLQADVGGGERLAALLDHPFARRASDVRVSGRWRSGNRMLAAITQRRRPGLRRLSVDEELGYHEPGCDHELQSLGEIMPDLKELRVRSERPLLHAIDHPGLVRLELEVGPLCDHGTWHVPALRELSWDPHIEAECDVDVFDVLWHQHLPALRHLSLSGELVAHGNLLDRPEVRAVVRRLETLCVAIGGIVPDPGDLTEQLLAHAVQLEHLSRLVVLGVDRDELHALQRACSRLPRLELDVYSRWGIGPLGSPRDR